eukprot:TRINITY_DN3641_c0_g1_i1.p1 TRINITY_DN3641_c0_g1~~TRINITY_DN3641_c0_g1_i1.p1  ORF type:complete len:217 (-),score=63.79 TRINITY_DN3641_c0_g1_i1:49-699(-)
MSKVAVVIGAGPGIGLAVAERFAREGFSIGLISRSEEKLKEYAKNFQSKVAVAPVDVSDESSLRAGLASIEKELGSIDVLVFNAASFNGRGKGLNTTADELVDEFKVGVAAAFSAIQAVTPHMKEKKQGTILLTGGGLALHPNYAVVGLSLVKAALRNLTQSLHPELKKDRIHIATVTVCGYVKPEDPKHNPPAIAEQYWTLYSQKPDEWKDEIIY